MSDDKKTDSKTPVKPAAKPAETKAPAKAAPAAKAAPTPPAKDGDVLKDQLDAQIDAAPVADNGGGNPGQLALEAQVKVDREEGAEVKERPIRTSRAEEAGKGDVFQQQLADTAGGAASAPDLGTGNPGQLALETQVRVEREEGADPAKPDRRSLAEQGTGEDVLRDQFTGTGDALGSGNPGQLALEAQVKVDREKGEGGTEAERAARGEKTVTASRNFSHGTKDHGSFRLKAGQSRAVPSAVAAELKALGYID